MTHLKFASFFDFDYNRLCLCRYAPCQVNFAHVFKRLANIRTNSTYCKWLNCVKYRRTHVHENLRNIAYSYQLIEPSWQDWILNLAISIHQLNDSNALFRIVYIQIKYKHRTGNALKCFPINFLFRLHQYYYSYVHITMH